MPNQRNVIRSPKESSPFTDEDQLEIVTEAADLVVNQPKAKPANGQKINAKEWTPIATEGPKTKPPNKTPEPKVKSPKSARSSSRNARVKPTKIGVDKALPQSQPNSAK